MDAGRELIDDDEVLYRRIPDSMNWYNRIDGVISPQAFAPHKTRDATGLSVWRAKYKTLEQVAAGRPGKKFYVALMLAGDLRRVGLEIVPSPDLPDGYDAAHAEIPQMNAANYKSSETLVFQRELAKLAFRVEGPFETPA